MAKRRYRLSPEGLASKREWLRRNRPWRFSTGPRTAAGKRRVAKNALRHGERSVPHLAPIRFDNGLNKLLRWHLRSQAGYLRASRKELDALEKGQRPDIASLMLEADAKTAIAKIMIEKNWARLIKWAVLAPELEEGRFVQDHIMRQLPNMQDDLRNGDGRETPPSSRERDGD